MTGFRWLNLQLVYDRNGKLASVMPVGGDLSLCKLSSNPEALFWVQKVNGYFVSVIRQHELVRLLIPTAKQT